jgi:hypothetical protein
LSHHNMSLALVLLILLPTILAVASVHAYGQFTIWTDKSVYSVGETVTIHVSPRFIGVMLYLIVRAPDGSQVRINVASDTTSIQAGPATGEYRVELWGQVVTPSAPPPGLLASCSFEVAGSPSCSDGQVWNGAQCVCPSGQQWNGEQCVTSTQQTAVTFTIQVVNANTNGPIAGASVSFDGSNVGQTDSSGSIQITTSYPSAGHTWSVSANGYQSASGSVSIGANSGGQYSVRLTPLYTCPTVTPPSVTPLNNFQSFQDYWNYVFALAQMHPYIVQDEIDVVLSDSRGVSNVQVTMSVLKQNTQNLAPAGNNEYSGQLLYDPISALQEAQDLIFFVIGLSLPGFADIASPPPLSGPPTPAITGVTVTLNDGTVCPTIPENVEIPTIEVQFNPQWINGNYEAAMSPVDMLVTDSNGHRVGSVYQNGAYVGDVDEISGALYSGHGTHPQLIYLPSTSGDYSLALVGTGNGNYTLRSIIASAGKQSAYQQAQGVVSSGQTIEYDLSMNGNSASLTEKTQPQDLYPYVAGAVAIGIVVAVFVADLRRPSNKARRTRTS